VQASVRLYEVGFKGGMMTAVITALCVGPGAHLAKEQVLGTSPREEIIL
jgi:hypothetical protein